MSMLWHAVKAEMLSSLINFQIVNVLNHQTKVHTKADSILVLILTVLSSYSCDHFDSCSGLFCS